MKCLGLALALALACSPALAGEPPTDATENIVALMVNGKTAQETAIVLQTPDGDLWLEHEVWLELGLVLEGEHSGLVSAKAIGVELKVDDATQSIDLLVPGKLLPAQILGGRTRKLEKADAQPKGVFINYDLAGQVSTDGEYGVSMGHEVQVGVGSGTVVSTGQLNFQDGEAGYIRGLTTWHKDFVGRGITVQAGDVFSPRSNLANPVNLAGVRIASDRGLRQGEGFYPVPLLGGIAETRSSAELYVNDVRTGQYAVRPGPYELGHYTVLRGANEVNLVVRDEFGREQVVSQRFYNAPDNLKKGATEFDVAVGLIRTDPREDTYGQAAVSGKIEHGVSDLWTVGATVQATKDSRNLTLNNRLTLGRAGALTVDYSQSTSPEGKGTAASAAYEYNARSWSVRAAHSRYDDTHWMLTDELGTAGIGGRDLKSITSVGFGVNPRGSKWNLGASAVAIDYHNGEASERITAAARYRTKTNEFGIGAGYDATTKDKSLSLTWRHQFGKDLSMSTQVKAAPDITAATQVDGRTEIRGREVQFSAGAAYAAQTQSTTAYGGAGASFAKGDLRVAGTYSEDKSTVSASWKGSLWIGEGGVAMQRSSGGSFVVVEVPGQAGLPVSSGGGYASLTNKRGFAVVPGVQPLARQSISIDSENLALDVGIENTTQSVVAGRRGGAKLVFDVSTDTMREVAITYQGEPVEPPATLVSSAEEIPVGMGGVAVLSAPKAGEEVTVVLTTTTSCKATMPDTIGAFEEIIPLDCK